MNSLSRKNHLISLLQIHTRYLQKLKEQEASFGLYKPPHLIIEIEDREAEINRLQAELEQITHQEVVFQTDHFLSKFAFVTEIFVENDSLLVQKLDEVGLNVLIWGPGEASPHFRRLVSERHHLYVTRKEIEKIFRGEGTSTITSDDFPGIFPVNLVLPSNNYDEKRMQIESADCIIVLDTSLDTSSEEYLLSERLVCEKTLIFLPEDAGQEISSQKWNNHILYLSQEELKTWALFDRLVEWLSILKLAKVLRRLSTNESTQSLVDYTISHEPVLTVLRDEFAFFLLYFIRNAKTISSSQLRNELALPDFTIAKYIAILEKGELITVTDDKIRVSSKSDNVFTSFDISVQQDRFENFKPSTTKREPTQNDPESIKALNKITISFVLIGLVGTLFVFWFLFRSVFQNNNENIILPTNSVQNDNVGTLNSYTLNSYMDKILDLSWSPDGKRLASGSTDNKVQIWDADNLIQVKGISTAKELTTLLDDSHNVMRVAWSPNGNLLAAGSQDGSVRVWDTRNGTLVFASKGHIRDVTQVSWSPNGKWLATGGLGSRVRIWDSSNGIEAGVLVNDGAVIQVIWSPDSTKLGVLGYEDNRVQVWKIDTMQPLYELSHQYPINQVVWSPDNSFLASRSSVGAIRIWDAMSGEEVFVIQSSDDLGASQVTWSPNSNLLVTATTDGSLWVWETKHFQRISIQQGHTDLIDQMIWSPSGAKLATYSKDKTVRVWNPDYHQFNVIEVENGLYSMVWLADGNHLKLLDKNGAIQIWNSSIY